VFIYERARVNGKLAQKMWVQGRSVTQQQEKDSVCTSFPPWKKTEK